MTDDMICSGCGCELHIVGTKISVEGDNSPDTQTKVYEVQILRCTNKRCPHPDEREIKHELPVGNPAGEA